ncbi:acetyl-CoA carboxylase carboxyltransferase subunit beta [bacterium]|nr:acetyl-CoA carboxylase carboxyltransferase subunit beta [bacterium]
MEWFQKVKRGLKIQKKKDIPDGLWIKCESCGEIIYKNELERNCWVCSKCQYHFRINSAQYVQVLMDDGQLMELDPDLTSTDPLKFKDTKKYSDRIKAAVQKNKMKAAVRVGAGKIAGRPLVAAFLDFSFLGGSMGSVVGEKIARGIRHAIEKRCPIVILSSSGGARMQEGILSLMQMAKTAAFLGQLSDAGLPYISILTHPTTGGVSASFAMLGDVNIAEPGALIGFAGPRVIEQTIGQELPEGFQRTEFLMEHGFVDIIVPRSELKEKIATLLEFLWDEQA